MTSYYLYWNGTACCTTCPTADCTCGDNTCYTVGQCGAQTVRVTVSGIDAGCSWYVDYAESPSPTACVTCNGGSSGSTGPGYVDIVINLPAGLTENTFTCTCFAQVTFDGACGDSATVSWSTVGPLVPAGDFPNCPGVVEGSTGRPSNCTWIYVDYNYGNCQPFCCDLCTNSAFGISNVTFSSSGCASLIGSCEDCYKRWLVIINPWGSWDISGDADIGTVGTGCCGDSSSASFSYTHSGGCSSPTTLYLDPVQIALTDSSCTPTGDLPASFTVGTVYYIAAFLGTSSTAPTPAGNVECLYNGVIILKGEGKRCDTGAWEDLPDNGCSLATTFYSGEMVGTGINNYGGLSSWTYNGGCGDCGECTGNQTINCIKFCPSLTYSEYRFTATLYRVDGSTKCLETCV